MVINTETVPLTRERFSRWRMNLLFSQNPDFEFLAHIAMSVRTIFTTEVETAGVTDDTLFINPEWCGKLTDEQGVGLLAHEILHLVFGHSWRRGDRDKIQYNVAADLVINQEVERCQLELPPGGQFIRNYGFPSGKSSEQYYEMLEGKTMRLDLQDLMDQSTEEGKENIRRIVQEALAEAERKYKAQGGLSKELMQLLFPRRTAKKNWSALANFLIDHTKSDFSWLYPSRRGPDLPALRSLGTKKILFAVDCSGSCWDPKIFETFSHHVAAITDQIDVDVELIYHDDHIQQVEYFHAGEFQRLKPKGNGGTDHNPVFKWIADNSNGFDPVVCLTDLETHFPEKLPANPVIWACVRTKHKAPFGKVIYLEGDGE